MFDQPQLTFNHSQLQTIVIAYCKDSKPIDIVSAPNLKNVYTFACSKSVISDITCNTDVTPVELTKNQLLGLIERYRLKYVPQIERLLTTDSIFSIVDDNGSEADGVDSEDDIDIVALQTVSNLLRSQHEKYEAKISQLRQSRADEKSRQDDYYNHRFSKSSAITENKSQYYPKTSASQYTPVENVSQSFSNAVNREIQAKVFKNRYDAISSVGNLTQSDRAQKLKQQEKQLEGLRSQLSAIQTTIQQTLNMSDLK